MARRRTPTTRRDLLARYNKPAADTSLKEETDERGNVVVVQVGGGVTAADILSGGWGRQPQPLEV